MNAKVKTKKHGNKAMSFISKKEKKKNVEDLTVISFSDQDLPEIRRLFPGAEVRHIEGAGHWVHAQKPREVLQAVTEFSDRHHNAS